MTFLHQFKAWPQFHWKEAELIAPLASVRHRQGQLMGALQVLGVEFQQSAAFETLTADVVQSSAIEGEILNPEEVRSSLARRLGMDVGALPPAPRSVDGVVEMTLDATLRFAEPLTEERLCGWHAALFPTGWSGMNRIHVGEWRTGIMQVVSGPIGREKVHFEAPAPELVAQEMAQFIQWFNAEQANLDLVLKAAIAHLWFVSIHPFDDGNGRIARALTDMMLTRADGIVERCYSMSAAIQKERASYYDILEKTQRSTLDVTAWLNWFLTYLGRALDNAQSILEQTLYRNRVWEFAQRFPINERQRIVLKRLMENFEGKLTSSKYAKLTKCSQDSATRDLNQLVEYGVLEKSPEGGRSTSYRLTVK
jgi:Fic family protein